MERTNDDNDPRASSANEPGADVAAAVAALYAAFADQPKPVTIDACPCCFDESEVAALLARDRETMTEQDLSSYVFNALTTVGDVDDFLYYLPRILELAAAGAFAGIEFVIGDRLRRALPATSRTDRRKALEAFVDAYLRSGSLSSEPSLDWRLDLAAGLGVDLAPHLARVEADAAFCSEFVLSQLDRAFDEVDNDSDRRSGAAFNDAVLGAWLTSERVVAKAREGWSELDAEMVRIRLPQLRQKLLEARGNA